MLKSHQVGKDTILRRDGLSGRKRYNIAMAHKEPHLFFLRENPSLR
jgi:hypothetical protein